MVKHSDRSFVPEYSDIVLGSMDGVMSVLTTYPKMISEIDDNSRIMTLDDFRKEIESDNIKGAGIDLCFIPDMYADYIEETNEELEEEKIELQAELKHCLKLNPFTSKIDTEFGAIDFFMCRRDTEGCRFSIIPHEWICHIRDAENSPLLTIYGSVYSEASDGSANSRQMFEICDMHTHQELHMYSGYRDLLQKSIDEGNEDMEDPDELMDTQLWGSPMVFVQYMKRNMSREDMKGAGLFALKHSLSCIHENLGGDGISVIVCPEIYGYFKKGEKRTALTKIRNMFDVGLVEEGFICNRIEYLKFEM